MFYKWNIGLWTVLTITCIWFDVDTSKSLKAVHVYSSFAVICCTHLIRSLTCDDDVGGVGEGDEGWWWQHVMMLFLISSFSTSMSVTFLVMLAPGLSMVFGEQDSKSYLWLFIIFFYSLLSRIYRSVKFSPSWASLGNVYGMQWLANFVTSLQISSGFFENNLWYATEWNFFLGDFFFHRPSEGSSMGPEFCNTESHKLDFDPALLDVRSITLQ